VREGRRRLNGDMREKSKGGTSPSGASEREREKGGKVDEGTERRDSGKGSEQTREIEVRVLNDSQGY
jgi:hypothetical protein